MSNKKDVEYIFDASSLDAGKVLVHNTQKNNDDKSAIMFAIVINEVSNLKQTLIKLKRLILDKDMSLHNVVDYIHINIEASEGENLIFNTEFIYSIREHLDTLESDLTVVIPDLENLIDDVDLTLVRKYFRDNPRLILVS